MNCCVEGSYSCSYSTVHICIGSPLQPEPASRGALPLQGEGIYIYSTTVLMEARRRRPWRARRRIGTLLVYLFCLLIAYCERLSELGLGVSQTKCYVHFGISHKKRVPRQQQRETAKRHRRLRNEKTDSQLPTAKRSSLKCSKVKPFPGGYPVSSTGLCFYNIPNDVQSRGRFIVYLP